MEKKSDTINTTVKSLPSMQAFPRETGTTNKVRAPSLKLIPGARRVCINGDPPRRSNNRRGLHRVTNLLSPEHFQTLSIRLSDVLDDIGAGKCTVMERRETYLRIESMMIIGRQISGGCHIEGFHFGSQSEGSTTPGLNSDIDFLHTALDVNIMTDLRDWEAGMGNLLMRIDDFTPPQQYLLQVIHTYTPEPVTSFANDLFVRKDSGEVLLSSERVKQQSEQKLSSLGEITKNGPSVSYVPNWDIVEAFHVCKPLPEIQHWIDRCRGRHWPPAKLLEAARRCPIFLVPAGHPDSDYKREEWRLSPNLIERMLMFSLNMTQIKCYICLKIIKKALLNKMVGDCTTSFHCKTLMFHTIERAHPSLWKEHNLMFLLLLCLQVLRKWLRLGSLPHYIIEGVNLFDGKLVMAQQRRLLQYVNYLIKNNLHDLFHIDIDKLGYRLQACDIRKIGQDTEWELGPVWLRNGVSLFLKFVYLQRFIIELTLIISRIQSSNTNFLQGIHNKLRAVVEHSKNCKLTTVAFDFINHLFELHNSVQSSTCLRLPNPAFIEIIRRFQYSFKTDVVSSRLKLASVLYCFGHLHAAIRVLNDAERRYHSKVKTVCAVRQFPGEIDLHVFANMMSDSCDNVLIEIPFAFCVSFIRQEAHCAPYILWFEMNRGMTEEEVAQRNHNDKIWMDNAEVSARPFLYYLQYLAYGGLGKRNRQLHALGKLKYYILDPINNFKIHHCETAHNLLGHCYEMEGDYETALDIYVASLHWWNTNNAATWHRQRVQRLMNNLE
ncbi:uncharacterized protein LOC127841025 [Dreissena polymorpha]|uniref:Mab-21-like HhH/H2TH-like domain-containing protein n=1 Tax=Dreissena polymorpha TaxID=45954 RepID=A0A9D4F426_DREPO|nr:uncharacterized protein LOC127841025 [Dreissena polymorpha]XP_052225491.1 uncharacterized protein LOC127841025 [Dreissena polymorpha]KAH3789375.1 hypothetical protein DPMN_167553 [Dreissena polymorpha]